MFFSVNTSPQDAFLCKERVNKKSSLIGNKEKPIKTDKSDGLRDGKQLLTVFIIQREIQIIYFMSQMGIVI